MLAGAVDNVGRTSKMAYSNGCSYVNYWLGLTYTWHLQHGGLRAVRSLTRHLALSIPKEQSRSYMAFSDIASGLCSLPFTAFLWLQVTKTSPDSERGDTNPHLSREEW